jgi:hypothetical protein
MQRTFVFLGTLALVACGGGTGENSMRCGISHTVAANRVLENLQGRSRLINVAPSDLIGSVPARVTGYGTRVAMAGTADSGVLVGFEGPEFPSTGFGVALVEDSTDTFKGILIYEDIEPPTDYPEIGTIVSGNRSIPLFGMRVAWSAVSDETCPLFAAIDSSTAR